MTELPKPGARALTIALIAALAMAAVGMTFWGERSRDVDLSRATPLTIQRPERPQFVPLQPADIPQPSDSGAAALQELAQKVQPKGAIPNEAVMRFASPAAMADFLKRAQSDGLVVKGRFDARRSVRVAYDSLARLQNELLNHGADIAGVGANFPVITPGMPAVEPPAGGAGALPFGDALMSSIGAGPTVDRSQWGSGMTVAVLDSGVASHPTFYDGQVTHIDLVNDGQPFEGHGTLVASLIGGSMDGAQGVSPAVKILDVRIAGASGMSDSFQLASGIAAALDRGAQIINISMGSYGDAPVVADAVDAALQRGVIIVAAAGNEQVAAKDWPAAYPGVISVSGVDASGHLAYFSNSGDPTLAAPAVGVPSAFAQNNQPYLATGDGTSQAAALVSGAAAAILSQGGNVLNTLSKSAQVIPANAQQAGAGMLHLPTK